jgi:excisionase family DNA binding protein
MDRATEWITTRELAKRLRVTPETVRAWARQGSIPSLRLSPKATRYNLQSVLTAISQRQPKGGTPHA